MTVQDKRELYKTAEVARDGKVFTEGTWVSVRVKYRMPGAWVFECFRGDGRREDFSEGYLRNFCL